jgi:excisionase family DNA binding protein
MNKELYRPEEVAEVLGISRAQVYRLLSQNALPVTKIGRSTRIPAVALRQWVEEHTTPASSEYAGSGRGSAS